MYATRTYFSSILATFDITEMVVDPEESLGSSGDRLPPEGSP